MRKRLAGGVPSFSPRWPPTCVLVVTRPDEETTLTVMSFNIWGGGANEDKPIDETVAAIEAVDPDIVGIQETQLEGPECTAKSARRSGQRGGGARRRARLRGLRADADERRALGERDPQPP